MALCGIIIFQPLILFPSDLSSMTAITGYLVVVVLSLIYIVLHPLYRKCFKLCHIYRAWLIIAMAVSNVPVIYYHYISQAREIPEGLWPLCISFVVASGAFLWGHLRAHLRNANENVA